MLKNMLLVFLGGGLGASFRYFLSYIMEVKEGQFPWNTFTANAIGSLLIGILLGYYLKNGNSSLLLFAGVGILGGFTTFSSFSVESIKLFQMGYTTLCLTYVLASVITGLVLAYIGLKFAGSI